MSDEIPDLWPERIDKPTERTPLSILKAQAEKIGPKTRGLVVGNVRAFSSPEYVEDDDELHHEFSLTAPALGKYRASLLVMHSSLRSLYPVQIDATTSAKPEMEHFAVPDEEHLFLTLRRILTDKRTLGIIRAIQAHSFSEPPPKRPSGVDEEDVPF